MMGKALLHTDLPLTLEEKVFAERFQFHGPFHLIVQKEPRGPSEQVWTYILEIKGIQLRPEQVRILAVEEGAEVRRAWIVQASWGLSPPAAGPRMMGKSGAQTSIWASWSLEKFSADRDVLVIQCSGYCKRREVNWGTGVGLGVSVRGTGLGGLVMRIL